VSEVSYVRSSSLMRGVVKATIGLGVLFTPFLFPNYVLATEEGTKGEPGWLQLNGKILGDGSADLFADGLVGAAPYAVGQRPRFGLALRRRLTLVLSRLLKLDDVRHQKLEVVHWHLRGTS